VRLTPGSPCAQVRLISSLFEVHSRRPEDLDLTDISTGSKLFALGSSLYKIVTAYRTGTFPDLSLLEAPSNANRRLLQ
jgi:hypothetical protein